MTGEAEDMQASFFYLTISLIFSIVFVYLVLAAQFESWLHPFTILLTLPLAAVGAYGILYGLNMTFSVFTFIGTIMLVGLVTKNGILLIDYANVLVARGNRVMEAAREAGKVRFRPVLMTAMSTILGMMPIALGYGAGGESRAPMGWSVAGGMFTATGLTLVVIPVVYTLFDDMRTWIRKHPWDLLRILLGVALVAAAGWLVWFPVNMGWGGFFLVASWVSSLVYLILAYGIFANRKWGYYLGMALGAIALIKGVLLWISLPLLLHYLPGGMDAVGTGQIIVLFAVVILVLLNLSGVRGRLLAEESL